MSGIALLRRLLMKQAMKKSADSSGIMSLNKNIVNDVDSTVKKWIDSAKKQGQDIDKMGEQEIKYLIELNKPKAPHTLTELMEKIGLNDPKKNKFLQKEGKVIQADFDKSNKWFKGKSEGVEDVSFKPGKDPYGRVIEESPSQIIVRMKAMTPMDAMKEANLVIARKGKYKNLTIDESQDILKKTDDHIFEREIKYDEFGEVIKPDPEDLAHGGRTGSGLNYLLGEDDQNSRVPYADGSKFNPKRRGFLKLAAGLASIPLIGKYFKWAKPLAKSSKVLTSVPIGNVSGMPAWFKPLVNRVIKEGDDVTKKFATQEREIVHQVSLEGKVGKDALGVDDVRVTQSLDDGTIRVQYNTVNSPGEYGVDLIYKKGEEIPLKGKKGSVKTKDEFSAAEAEPQYTGGPEDADIEWAGENVVNKVDDLLTDTTKLETYATGKNPTIKKLLKSEQKQKKTQQLNESNAEQANFIEEKYGPGPDPSDLVDDLVDDFASGGRVPLQGGGDLISDSPEMREFYNEALKDYEKFKDIMSFDKFMSIRMKSFATGGRVPLGGGYLAGGAKSLGKKYKGSTLAAILENPKLLGAELGHDGIMELMNFLPGLFSTGGRVPLAGGLIVKGGNWLIKALRGTREAIKKNKDYSPERIKLWVGQIDDQIRRIEAGGPIPDEVIQTIRKDPKFRSVWQNQKSADPDLREMEEVLLEYGQKHASGGLAGMLGE